MENKTLFRDMIPYRAGIVRITPLDSNFEPIYDKAYTTARDFLTSTQRSTSYSYETFYTSNGDASDYITQRRENITLTTQIYDPRFDALVSGKESSGNVIQSIKDIEIVLSAGSSRYIFTDPNFYPVASSDGKVHLEIRDSAGNKYTETNASPSVGQYKYNSVSHIIEFSENEDVRDFYCVYYVNVPNQESYNDSTILKNQIFMLEVYGEMQSASNGSKQTCYTCIKRASISNELTGITRQKSISNAITYTFSSAPAKRSETPCIELFGTL